jgi:hypothetical protein
LPLTFSLNRTLLLQLPDQGHDMKCIILAGGFGIRIGEESSKKPEQTLKTGQYRVFRSSLNLSASGNLPFHDACGVARRAV